MATALDYIHRTAEKIGRYGTFTTTSAGTTATLISSALINSSFDASEIANFAVLIESGGSSGQMGMVTPSGLAKATGTITVGDPFTDSIASGVTFSLYDGTRLPPLRKGLEPGLLQIANQSLERSRVEDSISIAGVTSQIHYSIDQVT